IAQRTSDTPQAPIKADIVCWLKDRQWLVGIEIPEDAGDVEVVQEGITLRSEAGHEARFLLHDIIGQVCISNGSELERSVQLASRDKPIVLFKLVGGNNEKGRRVKNASEGSYLVLAPDDWDRDEETSGPPPVQAEPTLIPGYLAHHFHIDQNSNGRLEADSK